MRSFRNKPIGWRQDSHRHYLAAKYGSAGISVSNFRKSKKLAAIREEQHDNHDNRIKKAVEKMMADPETKRKFEESDRDMLKYWERDEKYNNYVASLPLDEREALLKKIEERGSRRHYAKKCDTALFGTTKDEDAQTFIKRNVTAETNGDGLQQFTEDVSLMARHPMQDLDGEWEEYTSLAENDAYGKYGKSEPLSKDRVERAQQRGAALFGKVATQANIEPLVDKNEHDRTMRDITVDFLFGRRVR